MNDEYRILCGTSFEVCTNFIFRIFITLNTISISVMYRHTTLNTMYRCEKC